MPNDDREAQMFTTVPARQVRQGDTVRRGGFVHRVTRVAKVARGHVHVRTNRCDFVVKGDAPVEVAR